MLQKNKFSLFIKSNVPQIKEFQEELPSNNQSNSKVQPAENTGRKSIFQPRDFCFVKPILKQKRQLRQKMVKELNNSTKQQLNFSSQNLCDNDLHQVVAKCLYHAKVRVLDLSNNNITSKGLEFLLGQLRSHNSIQKIIIQNNSLDSLVLEVLLNHL